MKHVRVDKFTHVIARDEEGQGGANHEYSIVDKSDCDVILGTVSFQNGSLTDRSGLNGVMNEDLIAILIDRMKGFHKGKYRCRTNAIALTKLEEALMWLESRTKQRQEQGVEGTHETHKEVE